MCIQEFVIKCDFAKRREKINHKHLDFLIKMGFHFLKQKIIKAGKS